MKTQQSYILGMALKDFFYNYLRQLRGMSSHTILSYRDSLKLLLTFVAQKTNTPVSDLCIEAIGVDEIITFLDHLEATRRNGIGTRNIRLSAIHSFFRYIATTHPESLDQSQRILNIPFKRTPLRTVEYLEFEEIDAVLQAVDRSTLDGRRDYVLLSLMFNTGARVQEIVDLKATDLELSKPFSVRIYGKGRKERICTIWPETAHVLREYIAERGIDTRNPLPVFMNHLGTCLTRFGVRYILAKYLRKAVHAQPPLGKKRLHPHSMRHSTAVHLLKSGVDLSSIANWLGHVSINTTNKYATMDLEMKRDALAKAKPLGNKTSPESSWRKKPDILAWLESL
jgi:site-specific recombinase XerD